MKDEVLCDVFVEYKPRVRGAAVMKGQHQKKFGKEKKGRGRRVKTKREGKYRVGKGKGRCRSTVTMKYERNASETHKSW